MITAMIKKSLFTSLIREGSFRELFVSELGWNRYRGQAELPEIVVDDVEYNITAIAERSGFQILTCEADELPSQSQAKKIDSKLRRQALDYICIFRQKGTSHDLWVVPVRTNEKRNIVLVECDKDKADFLYSKIDGLYFELDENIGIVDLRDKVQGAFAVNSEKITKDFYSGFKKEHTAFTQFITGIDDHIEDRNNYNKQWYTSVMLNRLMFCYFIQKKGFLDMDFDYLRHKLDEHTAGRSEGTFFRSFYLDFLRRLFEDGLNDPGRNPEFEHRFGKIPYLNGGMFDEHPLEHDYADIDIADEAFVRLFDFFDTWRWHLDTRITASGKDINPDVLGYIFEQYINQRAEMGAYYTKEDITEYIGKNCILPFLMDRVAAKMPATFAPDGFVWRTLRDSGDRYIYDAVLKGYSPDWQTLIPEDIAVGLDTTAPGLLERRAHWNRRTPEEFALPTEIWRETIERFKRCDELRTRIAGGEILSINDFITYNLDIRSFVYDLVDRADDHAFMRHFYDALQSVTILDPTCGSGAFLFAAMNILEPLYEVSIERMQGYNAANPALFKKQLDEISNKYRSNIQYFIFKSIILRNLYGVDIMVEATEIAKLRLFLKMVAVVDVDRRADNLGIDPLPDIDFNIRCGNTLVGYANEQQLDADLSDNQGSFEVMLANDEFKAQIEEEMRKVALVYQRFKELQMVQEMNMADFKQAKHELRQRLATLNDLLNRRQFQASGMTDYDRWLATHQPFNWLAEFYQIIHDNGGFDVIIGNPPYVGYTRKNKETGKSVVDTYKVSNSYKTLMSSNLYAFTIERTISFLNSNGREGMIIPISAFANDSMASLQKLVKEEFGNKWISTYHQRPAQLFEGALQRLCIMIADNSNAKSIFTTGIYRWYSNTRPQLFRNLIYTEGDQSKQQHIIKIGSQIEYNIFKKYSIHRHTSEYITCEKNENSIYYRTAGGGYWVTFLNAKFDCDAVSNKCAYIQNHVKAKTLTAVYNSNLFWWYYSINYDLFNFKDYMIFGFQIDLPTKFESLLIELSNNLESNLRRNALFYEINSKTKGVNRTVTYQKSYSKPIMDEIDKVLAKHYGFTDEELDFIINYDIKYRMGDELNGDGV